ncbi:GntR family transcriptional regulator [Roseobacter denitrificans]|uniref:GntR-family transcription regulator, putative n=1 Tax=Roseobacter denitrificans (strain ATCC 33942 / OCh 114) TaxID=375451 RepID=Q16A81_ROSDO|nr:GntR family transcriptional regulator [Roseobacter denitrificans]ABG31112.1 GntR-family transcription regulator, putative [Roseobacter denitrificans OCh 114]AVL54183.1 GntR family transcriptional regulator [Roseobacter denitrificans]SFG32700.1 transcriptional regulator, GntR family [Roseobacter denitrificans OCh 114]
MELKRAEQIADSLEQLVFQGKYKDGQRLDEIKLAARFNVSRTPIREALQRLVMSGMAEQIPRKGVFVRQPGPVELLEMFETMAELEAACGRFAAVRMTDEGLERLADANVRCKAAVEKKDAAGYYQENEAFHREIYHGATNAYLRNEALRLQNRLKPYRRVQLRFRGRMAQSLAEHEEIIEALRSGEAELAATLLRAHVTVQGEKFQQLMAGLKN